MEKLRSHPGNHPGVLAGIVNRTNRRTGEIGQPVTTARIAERTWREENPEYSIGQRAVRNVLVDLETMENGYRL